MTDRRNSPNADSAIRSRLLARLRERDTSLWSDDDAVRTAIAQRLGWLDAVAFSSNRVDRIQSFADRVARDGFDRVVLLGMGGSSLAPEVFNRCFVDAPARLDMTVLDTTFPDSVERAALAAGNGRPLFIVSSKSGGTAETSALYGYFSHWCSDRFGSGWSDHFVAITDEGSALHRLAEQRGFRDVFLNPADIGGRYSALSLFGLVPAGLVGVDIPVLLDRARSMLEHSDSASAAVGLGVQIGRAATEGRDKLVLGFSRRIETLGLWIEQLVAESTGKRGVGVLPFVPRGFASLPHLPDECARVATYLEGDAFPLAAGQPLISIPLRDTHDLGAEFMRWQIATAIAASIMGINPFDEPDVNATKRATNLILRERPRDAVEAPENSAYEPRNVLEFLKRVGGHDYVALLAYLPSDQRWEAALAPVSDLVQERLGRIACVSLGPRYLHSSGQLHKGGRKIGHFLVLTAEPSAQVPVPGEDYDFGILIDAQARGDISVLRERGQRVLHIDLGPIDAAESKIREIKDYLDRHLQRIGPDAE